MIKYLEKVKKAFPSARWEKTEILPVYVLRHGTISVSGCAKYSPRYPFVGNARRLEIERGPKGIWNELLVPWPWFVALVAKPNDGVPLTGVETDPDRNKYFHLVYADEDGMVPFQVPREKNDELNRGFTTLRNGNSITTKPPKFKRSSWVDGVTDDTWKRVRKNGTMVSTVTA